MEFERRLRFEELEVRAMLSVSLPGNFDADNAVGASDYVLSRKTLGQPVTRYDGADANGNGVVDQADYAAWRGDFGATSSPNSLPGNFDADNAVGASDYVLWRKTLGQAVTRYDGADANGNGVVDQADYAAWRGDFGATSSTNWFDTNIHDAALRSCGSNLYADALIDRTDALALFREVEADGTVDATELADLQRIVSTPSLFGSLDYVQRLSSYTVNGYSTIVGLAAGASGATLEQRVDKWFLGADHPIANGTYLQFAGSLFVNGPSYTDIHQGALGDCYFMSSLAETALHNPSAIINMFVVNGDGTYTVRFYDNGLAQYVTVDSDLPTSASGLAIYGDRGALYNNANNELWTALAEKAYVQINEMGWLRAGPTSGQNSYSAIADGYIYAALGQITGQSTKGFTYTAGTTSFTTFVNAYNQGKSIGFASTSAPASTQVVANHAYAVLGYDEANQTITLFNPMGIEFGLVIMTWSQLQANFSYFDQTV